MMSREDDRNANSKESQHNDVRLVIQTSLNFFLRQDYIFAAEFRREKTIT